VLKKANENDEEKGISKNGHGTGAAADGERRVCSED
jgi:hypothetical protein